MPSVPGNMNEFVELVAHWSPRVGVGVFSLSVLLNVAFTATDRWLPFAFASAFMGLAAYYMLRFVVRFQVWVGNKSTTGDRLRRFLVFILGLMGVFTLELVVGLVLWPKSYVVTLLGIAIPTGVAISA